MRFFGKFRRKMVLNGKFKNYVLYAVGEIILIVLGILIAWKINNLNELRKNKIVQIKIYESLYEELNTNLDVLDNAIVQYHNNVISLKTSLDFIGFSPEDLTQEVKNKIVQVKFRNTNLRNEALSSVNKTDKFQFLENDSLTKWIAQYPTELKSFEDQELKIRKIVNERLKPILEEYISLFDMLPLDKKSYTMVRTHGQRSNYVELLNSKEYQNSIIDQLLQTQIQLSIAGNLREKTESLALKLNQELYG